MPIKKSQIAQASELLGKAFTSNPSHIAMFGKNNAISSERFFNLVLNNMTGEIFTALFEDVMVGVICMEKHPRLKSPKSKPPQLTQELLLTSEAVITRIQKRTSVCERLDLKESHYHFGPVGVLPEYHHRGIGTKMVEYCCRIVDRERESGYLETESLENVKFYDKFGFQIINELAILGVPNWFMRRFPLPKQNTIPER